MWFLVQKYRDKEKVFCPNKHPFVSICLLHRKKQKKTICTKFEDKWAKALLLPYYPFIYIFAPQINKQKKIHETTDCILPVGLADGNNFYRDFTEDVNS